MCVCVRARSRVCVCMCAYYFVFVSAPGNADHIVTTIENGRLIATVNGRKGTVCDDFATNALAMVVCREQGINT